MEYIESLKSIVIFFQFFASFTGFLFFKKNDFLYKLGNIIINYKNEMKTLSILIEKLSSSSNNLHEIFFLFYHLDYIVNLEKDSTFTLIDFILDNVK